MKYLSEKHVSAVRYGLEYYHIRKYDPFLSACRRTIGERGWLESRSDRYRSLIPLDKEAIFESVKKTSKALVVHEDKVFSGFGAELAAMIGEEMFVISTDRCSVSVLRLLPLVSIRYWKRNFAGRS